MQNSVAKKIFAVGVAAATAAMGLAPFVAFAAAHAVGTNVKTSDGTVWMVMSGNCRRAYTSGGAFLSYGFNSFATVVDANADDLALSVCAEGFIPPQDGKLITSDRGADKGTTYLISGAQKRGFVSAGVFTALGFKFARGTFGDVSWMSTGANIDSTSAAHLPGVLVNNAGTVLLVGTNGLLGIPSVEVFNGWGYSFADVVTANAADKAMTQTGVMASRVAGQLSPGPETGTPPPPPDSGKPPPPPPGGALSVSLSSLNPAASNYAVGAAFLPFTAINFTAGTNPVTVTTVKAKRMGLGADSNLNNMYLFEGATMLAQSASFQSSVVTFTNSAGLFTVPANSTKTIWIKGDLASGSGPGLTYGFGIQSAADVVSNASSVSGSFPVNGNLFTSASVSSPSLATLTVASSTVASSINAGTKDVIVAQYNLTSANSAVSVTGVTLTMIGTAQSSGLANLKLKAAGAQVGTTMASMPSNKVSFFDFSSSPLSIPSGQTVQLQLVADVVAEVNRTYQFSIQHGYDIVSFDTTYGVGILSGSTFPINSTSATINAGSLSITRSAESRNTSIVASMTGVKLATFDFSAYGEDMKILSLPISIVMGAGAATITNIKLADDLGFSLGTQVTAASGVTPTAYTNNFGSTSNLNYVVAANTTRKISIIADITSADSSATTMAASLTAGSSNAQGVVSVNSVGTSAASGNSLTVASSSFTATLDSGLASPIKVVPGAVQAKMASFSLNAGGADAVNITTITVQAINGSATGNLQNMKVKIGSTQIGQVQTTVSNNATYSFSPSSVINIPAGGSVVVDVYADLISSASSSLFTGHVVFTLTTGVTAQLATSGTSVSLAANVSGQTVTTAGNGAVTVSKDPSSPVSRQVAMGQSGVILGVIRFQETSNNEAVTLTDITITATAISGTPLNASASTSSGTLKNFVITDGTTTYTKSTWSTTTTNGVAEASGTSSTPSSHQITFNNVNFNIPVGQTLKLTVKADTNSWAAGGASNAQFTVGLNLAANATLRGQQSQASISPTLTTFAQSSTTTVVRSTVNVVAVDKITSPISVEVSPTGVPATDEVMGIFAFTASSAGDVTINTVTLQQGGTAPTAVAVPYTIYDANQYSTANGTANLTGTATGAITLTTATEITAGQTKYFVLRASTSAFNTAGTGAAKTYELKVTAFSFADGVTTPKTVVANSADFINVSADTTASGSSGGRAY